MYSSEGFNEVTFKYRKTGAVCKLCSHKTTEEPVNGVRYYIILAHRSYLEEYNFP